MAPSGVAAGGAADEADAAVRARVKDGKALKRSSPWRRFVECV